MTSIDNETRSFVKVGDESQIPASGILPITVNSRRLIICRVDGRYYVIEDRCSHDDGTLSDGELRDNGQIECPRHGARFDVCSGKAVCLPAIKAIETYAVDVRDGQIWLGLPPV